MRYFIEDLKNFLNEQIQLEKELWEVRSGSNYGIRFQNKVGCYFSNKKKELEIKTVKVNLNPNSQDPDIILDMDNGNKIFFEIKSCKNEGLSGVTICNSPELLTSVPCILINYTVDNSYVLVKEVIQTELHRLVTINKTGKYKGCLSSTRDTGKKIKGRNYREFISSSDNDDYTLEELTNPTLIRRTVLMYSASKLVDTEYNFTELEIFNAIKELKNN